VVKDNVELINKISTWSDEKVRKKYEVARQDFLDNPDGDKQFVLDIYFDDFARRFLHGNK
jgi:hypothetical protein